MVKYILLQPKLSSNLPTNTCFDTERIHEDIEIQPIVDNVVVNHYANDVECSYDTVIVDRDNMTDHDMVKLGLGSNCRTKQSTIICTKCDTRKLSIIITKYKSILNAVLHVKLRTIMTAKCITIIGTKCTSIYSSKYCGMIMCLLYSIPVM